MSVPYSLPMKPLNILVLHHDADRREELVSALRSLDRSVVAAASAADAAGLLDSSIDAILLDLKSSGVDLALIAQSLAGGTGGEPESLETAERRHLAGVLRHTGGNKRRAALILGISRSTLLNKVRKYHLEER